MLGPGEYLGDHPFVEGPLAPDSTGPRCPPPPPGDTLIDGGEHYWEVRYEPDSKAFGVGVAYRSLGRFEQLGKTAASWCLHVNNWLQVSFTAKHANKAKVLEPPVPDCLGVHCDFHQGDPEPPLPARPRPRAPLAAPTAPNPTLPLSLHPRPPVLLQRPNQTAAAHLQGQVHAAPAARFHSENGSAAGRAGVGPGPALRLSLPLRLTGPPVPGPQVWCGSFQVTTGLQVPSSVRCLQKRDSATSSSNTSLT